MHPFLLHAGHVVISSFGVLAALGVLGAMSLAGRAAGMLGLNPEAMWDAGIFAVGAAFVASRVLLLLTNLRGYLEAPLLLLTVPSLTVGGMGLTLLLTVGYLRRRRIPVLRAMDAWAAPGLLLWAALAMGHFLEGSDPGMPGARWGLRGAAAGTRQQPVALYAALLALGLAGVALDRTQARRSGRLPRPGRVAAWGLLGAGVAQFSLTFLRLPYLWAGATRWAVLDPIQWAALGMVLAGGVLWVVSETRGSDAGRRAETPAAAAMAGEG